MIMHWFLAIRWVMKHLFINWCEKHFGSCDLLAQNQWRPCLKSAKHAVKERLVAGLTTEREMSHLTAEGGFTCHWRLQLAYILDLSWENIILQRGIKYLFKSAIYMGKIYDPGHFCYLFNVERKSNATQCKIFLCSQRNQQARLLFFEAVMC